MCVRTFDRGDRLYVTSEGTTGLACLGAFEDLNRQKKPSPRKTTYVLTSHFLFTDRGSKVPLETKFIADIRDVVPRSYSAKGKASRFSEMDHTLTVDGNDVSMTRNGKKQTQTATGPWFITDGYSPVAMQEQMMRWWLAHGRPAAFNAYPSKAEVRIERAETLNIGGLAADGYTVGALIWGQESLWIDDAQNLIALVSTDAEFDHFEAVRQPYERSPEPRSSSQPRTSASSATAAKQQGGPGMVWGKSQNEGLSSAGGSLVRQPRTANT